MSDLKTWDFKCLYGNLIKMRWGCIFAILFFRKSATMLKFSRRITFSTCYSYNYLLIWSINITCSNCWPCLLNNTYQILFWTAIDVFDDVPLDVNFFQDFQTSLGSHHATPLVRNIKSIDDTWSVTIHLNSKSALTRRFRWEMVGKRCWRGSARRYYYGYW